MKCNVRRYGIELVPENEQDVAYIRAPQATRVRAARAAGERPHRNPVVTLGQIEAALATLDRLSPGKWKADSLQLREDGEYWTAKRVAHFGGQGHTGEDGSALCAAVAALRNAAPALLRVARAAERFIAHRREQYEAGEIAGTESKAEIDLAAALGEV